MPSFDVVVLDHPQGGPYRLEADAVAAAGGTLTVIPIGDLDQRTVACDVVVNAGDWPLTAARLDRLPGCRAAVSYGVGMDWIDPALARERGLRVVNTPAANVEDVAVHALAMILACARRLPAYDAHLRAGGFRPDEEPPRRLAGRTLGLLAFGNIARRLAELAAPLGMRIVAHDPHVEAEAMRALGVEPLGVDELLARADVLSVHLPASPETAGFLDARRLAALPAGAIVVITSRGAIYDPDALAAGLTSGHVAAAGVDVFPVEPPPADAPLLRAPNAILTPHVAGHTVEADLDAHRAVADSLAALAPAAAG
jgi:phosphoglycerate dehydrogenase-like enzyme